MAATATADVVGGRTHGLERIRHYGGVTARIPFLVSWLHGTGVAATAHGRSQIHTGPDCRIIFIGRMIGGRAMAVFALHAGKVRSVRYDSVPVRNNKSRRQPVTDRVAGQTENLGLAVFGSYCGIRRRNQRAAP